MPAPLYGQVAVSGAPTRLTSNTTQLAAFTIKAPASNSSAVFIGDSSVTTANGHQLDPGDTLDYELQIINGQPMFQLRPSDFWVVGTSGVVTWLGSPQ